MLMEEHNWVLMRKYQRIIEAETRCETFFAEDAGLVIVAYGTVARIAKGAVKRLRSQGMKVGLFRPITLWPFPTAELRALSAQVRRFLVFELSLGQMLDDVRLALQGRASIDFYGRPGGVVVTPAELASVVSRRFGRTAPAPAEGAGYFVTEGPLSQ
jgi:2-oxoglutarate ferredoxin oxidoreductase subunit alpha